MLVMLVLGVAQHQPADEPKRPSKGDDVVLRGCLTGTALESSDFATADRDGRLYNFVTYRLTGEKKLLEAIRKEHSGHLDIVHGVLKTDPPTTTVRRKQLGKTGISIGIGASQGMRPEPPPPMPVVEVKELEHTEIVCNQRR